MSEAPTNVVDFPGVTVADISPRKILEAVLASDPEEVVVITRSKDGFINAHSSSGYRPDILWLIEHARALTLGIVLDTGE